MRNCTTEQACSLSNTTARFEFETGIGRDIKSSYSRANQAQSCSTKLNYHRIHADKSILIPYDKPNLSPKNRSSPTIQERTSSNLDLVLPVMQMELE